MPSMNADIGNLLAGSRGKIPSKETLNNRDIIEFVSGLDVFAETPEAYLRAYHALGIDIINRVPEDRAPSPLSPGEVRHCGVYDEAALGIYNTVIRRSFPFADADSFLSIKDPVELDYSQLRTPVPHHLDLQEIRRKQQLVGDIGVYYYQLYTTLFMWGVEVLGWETYMTAAMLNPDHFDRMFLQPAFEESRKLISILAETECPFMFLHDDLADANGPVFPPAWYDDYIFSRYPELFSIAHGAGKKIIFVADGNMEPFLPGLRSLGVDGVMLENPATPFDAIVEVFGDRIIIGGAETGILTFGTPDDIRTHIGTLKRQTADVPGFVISTPGGIHGNIPLENLIAYFDARIELGATPEDWKTTQRKES